MKDRDLISELQRTLRLREAPRRIKNSGKQFNLLYYYKETHHDKKY